MISLNVIPILLTLGTQPDCEGHGMCILETESESTKNECLKKGNCIQAEMDYSENTIILIVSQSKINDHAFIKYFTKEYFELDRDFGVSGEVATRLGCPNGTLLPKGKYSINEEGGKIVVRFK